MSNKVGTVNLVTTTAVEAQPALYGANGILKPSPIGQEMINYLPEYMQNGPYIRVLQEALGLEVTRAIESRDDLLLQFFIDTATWGLKYWEDLAGIPVGEDIPDTYPMRRAVVKTSLASRRFEGEYWFVKRLEDLVGTVYVKDLEPEFYPYRIEIEAVAPIVEEPPTSNVTATLDPTAGNLDGQYTYRTTFVFPTGETTFGQGQLKVNEVQQIDLVGSVTGGTFTITYDDQYPPNIPPNPQTTADIPWDATPAQIKAALDDLANLSGYNPSVVNVMGGPLPSAPIMIEFVAERSGDPQVLMTIDSTNLTGGGSFSMSQIQAGDTTYGNSESNTIEANNEQIELTNLPISTSGAVGRRIYRKVNPDPVYHFVAEIPDNETNSYTDNIDDATVLAAAELSPYNTALNALGVATIDLIRKTKPAHLHVELTSEFFRASINSAGDRV